MRLLIAITTAVALVAVVAPTAGTAKKVLKGSVGPSFVITLKTAAGKPVKTVKAGTYTITVSDKSAIHNFRLMGPGVNKAITSVSFQGTKSITVKLKVGKYRYQCDPHASSMKGSFTVTT